MSSALPERKVIETAVCIDVWCQSRFGQKFTALNSHEQLRVIEQYAADPATQHDASHMDSFIESMVANAAEPHTAKKESLRQFLKQ